MALHKQTFLQGCRGYGNSHEYGYGNCAEFPWVLREFLNSCETKRKRIIVFWEP